MHLNGVLLASSAYPKCSSGIGAHSPQMTLRRAAIDRIYRGRSDNDSLHSLTFVAASFEQFKVPP